MSENTATDPQSAQLAEIEEVQPHRKAHSRPGTHKLCSTDLPRNSNAESYSPRNTTPFIVSPTIFAAFNANTDPSAFRKSIATLLPGVHPYRPGNHGISRPGGGYPAFRPATPNEALPVRRDGETTIPSARPGIAINIHRGSRTTTSSEGCQTIPPAQWPHFHATLTAELKRHALKSFPYILLDPGAIA